MHILNLRLVKLFLVSFITMLILSPAQAKERYAFGICQTATQADGAEIRPTYAADSYLANYHGDDPRYKAKLSSGEYFSDATISIVKAPIHGEVALADVPNVMNGQYHYMPEHGYIGRDNFVMQVEQNGTKVRIEYLIEGLDDNEPETGICRHEHWKISASTPIRDHANLLTQ